MAPATLPLFAVWEASLAAPGPTFCCGGRLLFPPAAREARAGLHAVAATLALATACFAATAALNVRVVGLPFTLVGAALVVLAWCALAAVLVSDPGILPRHVSALRGLVAAELAPPKAAALRTAPAAEARLVAGSGSGATATEAQAVKFCLTCRVWRPPGAHHCGVCNVCVFGFDHHCAALGKCIGAGNLRAFVAMLWVFVIASTVGAVFCLAVAISAALDASAADADWGSAGSTELSFWVAGGVMLGSVCCCAACMPGGISRCFGSLSGLLLIVTLAVGGCAALLTAFARVAGAEGAAAVPAFLGVPLFVYLLSFTLGIASTLSCTIGMRTTTKERLRRQQAAAAAAAATTAAAAAAAAAATSTTGSTEQEAKGAPELLGSAPAGLEPPPPFCDTLGAVLRVLCTPPPPLFVDFRADAAELREIVRAVERAAIQRVEAASLIGQASPGGSTMVDVATVLVAPASRQGADGDAEEQQHIDALAASLDCGYVDDALALGRASAAARPVRGVLLGLDLCVPGMRLLPAPPAPAAEIGAPLFAEQRVFWQAPQQPIMMAFPLPFPLPFSQPPEPSQIIAELPRVAEASSDDSNRSSSSSPLIERRQGQTEERD